MSNLTPTSTVPCFTFAANSNSGLGRARVGEPCVVASGTQAQCWAATGTIIMVPASFANAIELTSYLDLAGIATPSAVIGRVFRNGTDNNLYYCQDGVNWIKIN